MPNSKEIISASLLGRIPNFRSRDAHRRFSFGLGEWTDSSSDEEVMELERPTKKLKLSVSRARAQDRRHFISEAQEQALSKKFVPKNKLTASPNGLCLSSRRGNRAGKSDLLMIQRSKYPMIFGCLMMLAF